MIALLFCYENSKPESNFTASKICPNSHLSEFNGVPVLIPCYGARPIIPSKNQVGFKWALNDLVIFNNGIITWKLDHSITAHKPRYLLNRFRPATATTILLQELIWIIHGNFKTTVPLMVFYRLTSLAALHYKKWQQGWLNTATTG